MRRAMTANLTMYVALVVGAAWWFLVGQIAQGRPENALAVGPTQGAAISPLPVGVSYYAIQGFSTAQCSKALEVFNEVEHPSLAMLWGTFGRNNDCIRRYLGRFSAVPHTLEIHITNNACLRGRICRRGEIVRGISPERYSRLLEQRDRPTISNLRYRIREIAVTLKKARNANTRLMLSTGLEDNYSTKAFRIVQALVAEAQGITAFEVVRNPMRVRGVTADHIDRLEGHGFAPKIGSAWTGRCIANNDGDSIVFRGRASKGQRYVSELPAFIAQYRAQGCLVSLWWANPQGLLPKSGPRITPARRTYILRTDEIEVINGVLRDAEGE